MAPAARPSRLNPYVLAVLALAAATALRLLLGSLIGHHLPFVTYYAAVAIVAFFGNLGAAIAATIASGLLGAVNIRAVFLLDTIALVVLAALVRRVMVTSPATMTAPPAAEEV